MTKKEFNEKNLDLVSKYSHIPKYVLKRDLTSERIDKLAETLKGANTVYKEDQFPQIIQKHLYTAREEKNNIQKNKQTSKLKLEDEVIRRNEESKKKASTKIPSTDKIINNNEEQTTNTEPEELTGKNLGNSRDEEKRIESILKEKRKHVREYWHFYQACFYEFECKLCKENFSKDSPLFRYNNSDTFDTECIKKILSTSLRIPSKKIPSGGFQMTIILNNHLVEFVNEKLYELIEDIENEKSDVHTDVVINDVIENKLKKIATFVSIGLMQKGKSIEEINPDLLQKGQESEIEFANLPVWHNKKDMDKFVQNKIKLSDEEVKNTVYDDGREKLWNYVERTIRQLREEELIQDWANLSEGDRPGIWRLKNSVMDFSDYNIQESEEILENLKNTELAEISSDDLKKGIEEIRENFLVDEDTIREIVINIIGGRHIILAGPIGTGKTELSRLIPRTFWKQHQGYHIEEYTATADWNTTDVIGGIMPKMKDDKPSYQVELGCVPSTILKNWSDSTCRTRVARKTNNNTSYGTWLLIDEFNRADIDKAFGQLFTSLESKKLKIPSSEDSVEEITIPEDYRIIGTLNTADKSYLFHLSDALKRRFAYIEVNPPKRDEKEQEIYYALKNALGKIPKSNYEKYFTLDHSLGQKIVVREKSDQEFIKILDKAYNVLDVVRMSKPLGTAILKSIFQTILVSVTMLGDYGKALDIALRSNLVPQLENISPTSIETMIEIFFEDPIEFFKEIHKTSLNKEKYEEDFKNFLKFIGTSEGETKQAVDNFLNSNISDDRWENFRDETKKIEFNLKEKMFKKSLEEILRSSTLI